MSVNALRRAIERANAGDLDGYMQLYAEDVELHGYPPGVESWETLRGFYAAFFGALDGLELELLDAVSEGDQVAVRFALSGTHTGDLLGVPATGKAVRVEGQSFFRFRDEQVVVRWQLMDGLGLMAQMGALPAPA